MLDPADCPGQRLVGWLINDGARRVCVVFPTFTGPGGDTSPFGVGIDVDDESNPISFDAIDLLEQVVENGNTQYRHAADPADIERWEDAKRCLLSRPTPSRPPVIGPDHEERP